MTASLQAADFAIPSTASTRLLPCDCYNRQHMAKAFAKLLKPHWIGIGLSLLALTVSSLQAQPKSHSAWKQLFNGYDLQGWKHVGPGRMTVVDGLLTPEGGMGLLYWTGGPVGDCELRVVYKMRDENDNSGIFIRIPVEPLEEWMPVHYGYEVQIDNLSDEFHRTGGLYAVTRVLASPGKPGPEWNTMLITLKGNRTIVTVNGVKVTDFVDSEKAQSELPPPAHAWEAQRGLRPQRGWIGLQNHSDKDIVFFKEIAIRPF